jgi:hypothetical protein
MLTPENIDAAEDYYNAGGIVESSRHQRLYYFAQFDRWCQDVGRPSLPASEDTLRLYLTALTVAGHSPGSVTNHQVAISWMHLDQGQPDPAGPRARQILAGIRRISTHVTTQAHPLTPGEVAELLARDHRRFGLARATAVLALSRQLDQPTRRIIGLTVVGADLESEHPTLTLQLPATRKRETVERVEVSADGDHRSVLDGGAQLAAALRQLERRGLASIEPLRTSVDLGRTVEVGNVIGDVRHQLQQQGSTAMADQVWGRDLTDDQARTLLASLDRWRLTALRNDAMLTALYFGALRIDETRRAVVDDWLKERTARGVALQLPSSKTDREGRGQAVVLPWQTAGGKFEPAHIIDTWVAAAGLGPGDPLFPTMQDGLLTRPLEHFTNGGAMRRHLAVMGSAAELDAHITGHSGRRGWATAAASEGMAVEAVMSHTRHVRVDTLRRYVERSVAGPTVVAAVVQQAVLDAT